MYLSNLFPTPKSFREDKSMRFRFGARAAARVSGLSPDCAERVKALWHRFSCDASDLDLTPDGEEFRFTVGEGSACLGEGDSYAVSVTEAGLSVVGRDALSLMNGIETLVQLICPADLNEGSEAFTISSAEIHDSPAIPFRAIHFCAFIGTRLYQLEQAIHMAGFLKMTHVILEFWGTFPYECQPAMYWKDRHFTKAELGELARLAQSYGMEIIPMINHFGHATQARSCNGRHVTLNANPRLSLLFEPDGWTWCVSNPDTYKLLAEMREEQTEWAGAGKYFHLGFDEAGSFATCERCGQRVPHELLAEYVNRLTEDLSKEGRRPIIWHDMLIRRGDFPAGHEVVANGEDRETFRALDRLDRRVIMADWNYGYRDGFNPTTSYFIGKGFDTVICPWDNPENIRSICADVKKTGASGVILTTWHHLENFLSGGLYWANCAWSAAENNFGGVNAENACILRRLYDAEGKYEESGWRYCEVEHP